MIYTVKYRKKGQWFWRVLKKVKGDMVGTDLPGQPRIFFFEDESRLEIPSDGTEFLFDHRRYLLIKSLEDKAK